MTALITVQRSGRDSISNHSKLYYHHAKYHFKPRAITKISKVLCITSRIFPDIRLIHPDRPGNLVCEKRRRARRSPVSNFMKIHKAVLELFHAIRFTNVENVIGAFFRTSIANALKKRNTILQTSAAHFTLCK